MPTVSWLNPKKLDFPALEEALEDPNGLLAVGGDLSTARLLNAYRHGIFPWYEDPQPILWWSPNPRAVLFPSGIHLSRSLRRRLARGEHRVTMDNAFERVIRECARLSPKRPGTWITDDMLRAYSDLHEQGWAHSVEVWHETELIGGLYGVAIGRVFFGESMFSARTDGSKIALVYLAGQLKQWGYRIIDCQVGNSHLYRMGAEDIDRAKFSRILQEFTAIGADEHGRWQLDWQYNSRIFDEP